jgi:hypothetical protein
MQSRPRRICNHSRDLGRRHFGNADIFLDRLSERQLRHDSPARACASPYPLCLAGQGGRHCQGRDSGSYSPGPSRWRMTGTFENGRCLVLRAKTASPHDPALVVRGGNRLNVANARTEWNAQYCARTSQLDQRIRQNLTNYCNARQRRAIRRMACGGWPKARRKARRMRSGS